MSYVTTTSYGSWFNHTGSATVGHAILDQINGGDAEWRDRMESTGALDQIEAEYRDAINAALPTGVVLTGNSDQFLGPYYEKDFTWKGELNIGEIIAEIDLQAIIDRHDVDNQEGKMTTSSTSGFIVIVATGHDIGGVDLIDLQGCPELDTADVDIWLSVNNFDEWHPEVCAYLLTNEDDRANVPNNLPGYQVTLSPETAARVHEERERRLAERTQITRVYEPKDT